MKEVNQVPLLGLLHRLHCFLEEARWAAKVTGALEERRERLGIQDNQVSPGDQDQWGPGVSLSWAPKVVQGFPAPLAPRATVDPVLLAHPVPLAPPEPPHDTAQQ